ncbi:MAG: hypothetical protein IT165_23215 [Bryobacterales bacterium]|nr:hypothetical protein [Bryobacterales bacterium]
MGIEEKLTGAGRHRNAVEALIRFDRPVGEIRRMLAPISLDANLVPPAILRRADVLSVLQRFLDGHLEARDLERWAELFEGRSDVQCEDTPDQILDQVMLELAHPLLYEPITKETIEIKAILLG